MDENTLDKWIEPKEEVEYLNNRPKENKPMADPKIAKTLSAEAWRLYNSGRSKEALVLINVAISHDSSDHNYFNIKGIVLEDLNRYSESRGAYDVALNLNPEDMTVKSNKVRMMYDWANSLNDKKKALEIINEAIEIAAGIPEIDLFKFWYLKGSILDCMSQPIEARKCYLMAEGQYDEVEEIERQMETITNSKDILINITGTQFYFGFEPFRKGVTVDLICEENNEHDPDAIRVEIDGETVGYVANSEYTLMEGISSASDIRKEKFSGAEILFIYFETYIVAKLILNTH